MSQHLNSLPGECTGTDEHSHCEHLLRNLLSPLVTRKAFMADVFRVKVTLDDEPHTDDAGAVSILSGSRAELLNLPGFDYFDPYDGKHVEYLSDLDFMVSMNATTPMAKTVVLDSIPRRYSIVSDFADIPSGVTDLTVTTVRDGRPGYCYFQADMPNGGDTQTFIDHQCFRSTPVVQGHSMSGVAVTEKFKHFHGIIRDFVPCLLLDAWPEGTRDVFHRQSTFWPSEEQLTQMSRTTKLLVVQKSHPLSKHTDIEFRFSFSMMELFLSRSLSDDDRHVYLVVKLLRELTELKGTQLKTYHLKTLMYWMVQREPPQKWKSMSFREKVVLFLTDATEAFQAGCLCNFFLPKSNLIDHLTTKECSSVVQQLERLRGRLCGVVLDFHTIIGFDCPTGPSIDAQRAFQDGKSFFKKSQQLKATAEKQAAATLACLQLKKSLQFQPGRLERLVMYGHLLWSEGDSAGALVAWLNALILFDPNQRIPLVRYCKQDYCFLDPALRLELQIHPEFGALTYLSSTLATYYLVKYQLLPENSSQHIVETIGFEIDILFDLMKVGTNPMGDHRLRIWKYCYTYGYPELGVMDVERELFTEKSGDEKDEEVKHVKHCHHCTPGAKTQNRSFLIAAGIHKLTAVKDKEHVSDPESALKPQFQRIKGRFVQEQVIRNVRDVALAACEYVEKYRPSYMRRRRHSFSGTSFVSAEYRKQDLRSMTSSLYSLGLEGDADVDEVYQEGDERCKVNAGLKLLTLKMLRGGEDAQWARYLSSIIVRLESQQQLHEFISSSMQHLLVPL